MATIGFHASHEQIPPEQLLRDVSNAQNAWAEAVLVTNSKTPCDDAERVAMARTTLDLGPLLRDAAQTARVRTERASWMIDQPTVAPLISRVERDRMADLRARAVALALAYETTAAWQQRNLSPALARCAKSPSPARPPPADATPP